MRKHKRHARPLAAGLMLALLPLGPAGAQVSLPSDAPIPLARPYAPVDETMTTGTVRGALERQATGASARAAQRGERLKAGLDAIASGDLARARQIRDNAGGDELDRRILMWAIAMSGGNGVSASEIAAAGHTLGDWPGMTSLRAHSERALYREDHGPRTILGAFGNTRPETMEGAVLLARAHLAVGNTARARAVLAPRWHDQRMEARLESTIIREFGTLLTQDDHRRRMEQMLHFERVASAERVAPLARAQELYRAWAAVTRNDAGAGRLIDAVPQAQRGPGYLFAKSRHLRRTGKYEEAAETMLSVATDDRAALVDPDSWWIERRVLSREMLDLGDYDKAYRIAAEHAARRPDRAADAEFHAGWYALRFLDEPQRAAVHFARIVEISEGPISLSRGHYWLGRAIEEGAEGDADAEYRQAARHGTAFYGQLAAARLGLGTAPAGFPEPTRADRLAFDQREAVQAIRRLETAGHAQRAAPLYRVLAEDLDSLGELALLSQMAESRGDHMMALRVGKWASARGMEVGSLAHPVGAIPENADISGAGKALAYAIARQESEFNTTARSGAGALGLLQLLPGTARDMARKTGLTYSQGRLTSDAGYNATLGAAYLQEQLDRFAGSYILTFAGYNAGPGNARRWVERYGDPQGKPIDEVVDWIERIPFHETRAYVQRVMENYQVYKMRLSGTMNVAADLTSGRR